MIKKVKKKKYVVDLIEAGIIIKTIRLIAKDFDIKITKAKLCNREQDYTFVLSKTIEK